jgi:hypothetical protein
MKYRKISRKLQLVVLLIVTLVFIAACNTTSSIAEQSSSDLNPASTTDTGDTDTASQSPAPPDTATSEGTGDSIPSGSIALFATLSGGINNETLKREGGNISWNSTHYKFLRYVPEVHILHEFSWTTSQSYAKSYIYGLTVNEWVYIVRCGTDTGRKDITRVDPKTGEPVGTFGSIYTSSMYGGFTISGDRLIYRSKIGKDLYGNRQSGGHVMSMEIGSIEPVKVLDYYDDDNTGAYYTIGDDLISIITSYEDDWIVYDIYRVNPVTLARGEQLFTYASEDHITFYEGTTSLYWSETDSSNGDVSIIRFALSGQPEYYLTISEDNPQLRSIDESQGKVLIVFTDSTPESPYYYLADLTTDEIVELDVNDAFFSTLIHGNGQFVILD